MKNWVLYMLLMSMLVDNSSYDGWMTIVIS